MSYILARVLHQLIVVIGHSATALSVLRNRVDSGKDDVRLLIPPLVGQKPVSSLTTAAPLQLSPHSVQHRFVSSEVPLT